MDIEEHVEKSKQLDRDYLLGKIPLAKLAEEQARLIEQLLKQKQ